MTVVDDLSARVEARVIADRRDIHQNPELGNREFRTAKLVAGRLRELGIETTTGIAHTGVAGLLRGAHPGRVVALRADMDALPVREEVDLPFASKVQTTYDATKPASCTPADTTPTWPSSSASPKCL